jgi:hypothetical protein
MRIIPLLMLLVTPCATLPTLAGDVFGLWSANPVTSTAGSSRERLTVRFEPHSKGEVFTVDRIDGDGRSTTSSTILYLDGKPRDFRGFGCSGTQSSRRVDSQTVEILRSCTNGEWTRFVRRSTIRPKELVLEITDQQSDGRRFERRLILEKQFGGRTKPPKSSENETRER